MNIKQVLFLAAFGLTASATFTSCDDVLGEWSRPAPVTPTEGPSVFVTSITLAPTSLIMNVGDAAVTLTATVAPDNASDKTITWSSDNTAAATVADGVVTAVGAGTAIITATANDGSGVKATCNVTVLLPGKFTINASGDQVQFSQGNLQATYDGSAWTWAFAANQWDYIGKAEGNTKVSDSAPFVAGYTGSSTTVDLFGWVGASSTWTGVNQYGITSSTATNATDGYGNVVAESLKSDWGTLAISNGGNIANFGWRTLTREEWTYLFNTRSASTVSGTDNARYAKAYLFGTTHGVILFPDSYTHPDGVANPTGINKTYETSWDANQYSAADWAKMEAAGCVFLPAAGYRNGTSVSSAGSSGYYWSSSPHGSNANDANIVYFIKSSLVPNPSDGNHRDNGFSVRLVRPVE